MLDLQISLALDYEVRAPAHFCLNIQPSIVRSARTQTLQSESLRIAPADGGVEPALRRMDDMFGNRLLRFDAQPGMLEVRYRLQARLLQPDDVDLVEHSVTNIPDACLAYLVPSRFCESDVLAPHALQLFGALPPGAARVEAIVRWVRDHVSYEVGSSDARTTAADVFERRRGVCRDFAHLCIAFCRALNMPARMVVGYTLFDEPPQDFHAIFEVWLGEWVAFDPTGLADPRRLLRVGKGFDAKNVAFATIFGAVTMTHMQITMAERDPLTGDERRSDDDRPVVAGKHAGRHARVRGGTAVHSVSATTTVPD